MNAANRLGGKRRLNILRFRSTLNVNRNARNACACTSRAAEEGDATPTVDASDPSAPAPVRDPARIAASTSASLVSTMSLPRRHTPIRRMQSPPRRPPPVSSAPNTPDTSPPRASPRSGWKTDRRSLNRREPRLVPRREAAPRARRRRRRRWSRRRRRCRRARCPTPSAAPRTRSSLSPPRARARARTAPLPPPRAASPFVPRACGTVERRDRRRVLETAVGSRERCEGGGGRSRTPPPRRRTSRTPRSARRE